MTEKSGRSPSIIAELRNKFHIVKIAPFGDCLVVPLKELSKFQEQRLKDLGYKVIYQEHDGHLCGLIVLTKEAPDTKPENEMQEAPTSPTEKLDEEENMRWRIWSVEEVQKLESLSAKDTSVSELADLFHRSPSSIRHKLDSLKVKRVLEGQREDTLSDDQTNIPDRKPLTAATTTATKTPRDILVREYLEAAASLISTRPKAAVVLQKEALFLSANGEGESDREED